MAFLKLKPAAEQLGVPYYWLREQAVKGAIPAFRTGGDKGTWLVDLDEVKSALQGKAALQQTAA